MACAIQVSGVGNSGSSVRGMRVSPLPREWGQHGGAATPVFAGRQLGRSSKARPSSGSTRQDCAGGERAVFGRVKRMSVRREVDSSRRGGKWEAMPVTQETQWVSQLEVSYNIQFLAQWFLHTKR